MKARLLIVFIFEVVLNTEWGALGNTGSLDFVRTWWDQGVEAGSKNFGKQVLKSAAIFANVHFLFCCKLCPKLIVNRLKCGLLKGLWKADQWDVPWRTLQTGWFWQKLKNLKSPFYLFQVLLEASSSPGWTWWELLVSATVLKLDTPRRPRAMWEVALYSEDIFINLEWFRLMVCLILCGGILLVAYSYRDKIFLNWSLLPGMKWMF